MSFTHTERGAATPRATASAGLSTCWRARTAERRDAHPSPLDRWTPIEGQFSTPIDSLPAGKSILLIKNPSGDTKDKLLWKWVKGALLTQMDLANPLCSASYAVCVYAGPGDTLVADAALPPDGHGLHALALRRGGRGPGTE